MTNGFYRAASMQGLDMREMSVCLSVRLSNVWIVKKRKKRMPKFLYPMKDTFI